MGVEEAVKICRKYGIKHFKTPHYEFTLDNPKEDESKPPIIDPKLFSNMPTDDEMLYAATEGITREEKAQ
jgi:hypothetical protein